MSIKSIESLKIDGLNYELEIVDTSKGLQPSRVAEVDLTNLVIRLAEKPEPYMYQALWHEIIHVIDDNRLGFKLSETETNSLACGICQVLLDNWELAMYPVSNQIEFEPEEPEQQKTKKKK